MINEKENLLFGTKDESKALPVEVDSKQILSVIEQYSHALDLLDAYDHQTLKRPKGNEATYVLTYEECLEVIQSMRFGAESDLF